MPDDAYAQWKRHWDTAQQEAIARDRAKKTRPEVDIPELLTQFGLTHEIHEPMMTVADGQKRVLWTEAELLEIRHLAADWMEGRR